MLGRPPVCLGFCRFKNARPLRVYGAPQVGPPFDLTGGLKPMREPGESHSDLILKLARGVIADRYYPELLRRKNTTIAHGRP